MRKILRITAAILAALLLFAAADMWMLLRGVLS